MTKRTPLDVLRTVFGHQSFREPQEAIIEHVIAGGDAIALLPTGKGKSACYQIPALCMPGTAIVVSPLLALMRDQVDGLVAKGVKAASLNSTLTPAQASKVRKDLLAGELDILYVTPERLALPSFVSTLRNVDISLFAIDEAHCVSQWGHEFRPEYGQLDSLKAIFPDVPRIALTATADPQTRQDLVEKLDMHDAKVFVSSFDRPNIDYVVQPKQNARAQMLAFLDGHRGSTGIVYCLSRKKVEQTAEWLSKEGFKALPYHAGLDHSVRERNQERFLKEDGLVLCATVAFGMGIDKPNVRFVGHMDLPSSVEGYYQETGRAGRDGLPSEAFMVYGLDDLAQRRTMIDKSKGGVVAKRVAHDKLTALIGIAETSECRRQAILTHFGESHPGNCGGCDTCREPVRTWDASAAAAHLLRVVDATGGKLSGHPLIQVLTGAVSEVKFAKGKQPVELVGPELPVASWNSLLRQMVASGILVVDHAARGALRTTEISGEVLSGERGIHVRKDREFSARGVESAPAPRVARPRAPRPDGDAPRKAVKPIDLYQALARERMRLARKHRVKPYIVFHDKALQEMVSKMPETISEMAMINGVGETKLERFGRDFLAVIARYADNPAARLEPMGRGR